MGRHQQTLFFATRADMARGIQEIESARRLKYALCDEYESLPPPTYSSLLAADALDSNPTGKAINAQTFLVTAAQEPIKLQTIERPRHGTRYALTQEGNPKSIVVAPSGFYQDEALVVGKAGTVSDHPEAITLYKYFARELTRGFTKVRMYLVGPEALQMLDAGRRLVTIGVGEEAEYDLRR